MHRTFLNNNKSSSADGDGGSVNNDTYITLAAQTDHQCS